MRDKKYPEPTVGALILNDKNEILLIKSFKWKDKFTIPGGHIEIGESIEEALRREVKEEVNLDIEVIKFLICHGAIFSEEFYKPKHYIFLDFLCRAKSKRAKADQKEAQKLIWASPQKAVKLNIDSFTRKTIETYLREFKPPD